MKQSKQYDKFIHKIQQEKMKELWDNEEDRALEKSYLKKSKNINKNER